MIETKCNMCELLCGFRDLLTAAFPADNPVPLPGRLPDGEPTDDIRPFCRDNYIKPEPK